MKKKEKLGKVNLSGLIHQWIAYERSKSGKKKVTKNAGNKYPEKIIFNLII